MVIALLFLVYIYSSVQFSYFFTYIFHKKRLDREGSRNIGVANAFRTGGFRVGFLSVLGDVSKALLPILLSSLFYSADRRMSFLFLLVAVFGTRFPLFLIKQGGKGRTVAGWGMLFTFPLATFLLGVVWTAVLLISRMDTFISLIVTSLAVPLLLFAVYGDVFLMLLGIILTVLVLLRSSRKNDDFIFYGVFRSNESDK
ncbi:hypothetical protein DS66_06255 [Mesotoga sp. SC_3PWM13N19]|nr:hypothetical protein DS66_06255 [Mesotoga sp. SC_3PWM13N19]